LIRAASDSTGVTPDAAVLKCCAWWYM
jgi:hypothetical protein